MTEKFKLDLIKKEIDKSEDYGVPVKETRWFVETNDGFDGTANGYGYKTPQAIYKAYAYFKSKDQRKQQGKEIKQFLASNPDIRDAFDEYFHESNCIYRLKDREPTSVENMITYIEDQPEVVKKLQENKHLWKALMKHYLDN